MVFLTHLMLWGTLTAAAGLAWLLLWSDSQDRLRALRAQHDERWGCACSCPGLPGYHAHRRCEFGEI